MLDLRRLHTFREVAERRSFSAAAAVLDYTQSSVSQQITTLEEELGLTLIDRGGRPVRPTAAGELVLAHADALLVHAAAAEREITGVGRGEAGTLRLSGFFTAWATFVPAAVAEFSRARPHVALELHEFEPEPALRAMRAGDLDLAVVYRFDAPEADERTAWTHLLDDAYAIALPAAHPLAARERVGLDELAAERWVSPPAGDAYARMLRDLCREHGGFEPEVAYESGDIAMAQPLVAAGLAVALLPELGLVPRHDGVVVRPLPAAPPARSVWVVTPSGRRVPAAAEMSAALVRAARSR